MTQHNLPEVDAIADGMPSEEAAGAYRLALALQCMLVRMGAEGEAYTIDKKTGMSRFMGAAWCVMLCTDGYEVGGVFADAAACLGDKEKFSLFADNLMSRGEALEAAHPED